MKRFTALITLMAILLSACVFSVFAEEKTEIIFCVGDDTLTINGEQVKVEKPYVVGEGVTLVPVRVITEGFNAVVDWDGETRSVFITYPDVKIALQIGNSVAEVNGVAETLLSAPEIKNNVTMVPLRFISETFGAEVSYDEKTRDITVTKGSAQSDSSMVEGGVDSKIIGDSYYGWSMENPTGMQMSERNFDGSETSFAYDENNYIDISVLKKDKDYDFNKSFTSAKNYLTGYTLVKADKLVTSDGINYMHIRVKNKTEVIDIYEFEGEEYIYYLDGAFSNDKEDVKNEGIRILSTFKCSFNSSEAYDLSDVRDGMRTYKAEALDFEIDIPENFYISEYTELDNEQDFYVDDPEDMESRIAIRIYSKSTEGSAKEVAEKDYLRNTSTTNKDLAVFSELTEKQYTNVNAYEYTLNLDAAYNKYYLKDVFFEIGDYVYNVCVYLINTMEGKEALAEKILNSFNGKEIDSEKIGILMRNLPEEEGTYTFGSDVWSIDLPAYYSEYSANDNGGVFVNLKNNALLSVQVIKSSGKRFNEVLADMKEIEAISKKEEGVKITETTKTNTLGSTKYADMSMTVDNNSTFTYVRELACLKNGYMVVFISNCSDAYYTDEFVNEIETFVQTFKIK